MKTEVNSIKLNRNIGIDILRGLCILAVILLHLNIQFDFSKTFLKEIIPKKLFSLLFWSGFYGVVIFFTLSGYLITNSILKRWGTLSKISIKTFYWYRFARIIPLLTLVLIVLSILHITNVQGFIINNEQTSLTRAIFSALTFHINWLEIKVGYLPANWDVLWSISIEESFYLIFPLICAFLKKDWNFILILTSCLIISPLARTLLYVGNELADKNHFAYLDSIALGCMSAIIATKIKFNKLQNKIFLILGCFMSILILYFRGIIYKSGIASAGLNVTILSLGISLILLWTHNIGNTKNKITNSFKWLLNMGKYSYEIYLTHMFVVLIGVRIFNHFKLNEKWLIPFSLIIIFISFLLGKLIFNYFSEPINIQLRKKWNFKKNT